MKWGDSLPYRVAFCHFHPENYIVCPTKNEANFASRGNLIWNNFAYNRSVIAVHHLKCVFWSPLKMTFHTMQLNHIGRSSEVKRSPILGWGQTLRILSFPRLLLGHVPKSETETIGKCVRGYFQPFECTIVQPSRNILKRKQTNQGQFSCRNWYVYDISNWHHHQPQMTIQLQ